MRDYSTKINIDFRTRPHNAFNPYFRIMKRRNMFHYRKP
jgi:hypothetical protein